MKYLVTAALPYANGPLHLGHVRSTYLPADIYSRFLRMFGEDVKFVCATDEHGTPIVVNAEKEKKTPKEFVDYYHELDKEIFLKMGFSFDSFHRTSSKENFELTQHFFKKMNENGYIYEHEVKQLFCTKCKRALPDRMVKGKCPYCGAEEQYGDQCEKCGHVIKVENLVNPYCAVCGTSPIVTVSKHYFFRLSAFSDRLREWIVSKQEFQDEVKRYVLSWIENGLHDWDITRDLEWGIPVPGSTNLVFYVWFDAPICYVSSTKAVVKNWEGYWKGDDVRIIHFIGKDISYHHYLFWPAMLMAVDEGYALPYAIPVRGYLNLEGEKFSKSKGWYISIEDFLKIFPADYLRFYETVLTPYSASDADFYWRDFEARINNELVANVGNFIYRTLSMIKRTCDGRVPEVKPDYDMLSKIMQASGDVKSLAYEFKVKEALDIILSLSSEFNAYLSANEPWKKTGPERDKILKTALHGVHALSVLLFPYIPESCQRLRKQLRLDTEPSWMEIEGNITGKIDITELGEVAPLFSKVDDKVIKEQESLLRGDK
ncbi:MAG: methionine--tRNA ligase [Candidatus Micrarchaeia archaeon]